MAEVIGTGIAKADAILLGRRTYLEFAELWPKQGSDSPMADFMNNTSKFIVSSALHPLAWAHSSLVTGDLAEVVARATTGRTGPATESLPLTGTSVPDISRSRRR